MFHVRWLWTLLPGICTVAWTFREIFQDLFHPTQTGSLSEYVGRNLFRLLRRRPALLSISGPLTLVIVILSWVLLQALGFALIYWAACPEGFHFQGRERVDSFHGFGLMFYFSLQMITTLGLGDVLPLAFWIRMLTTFEALVGLALLTASVSSILLLYPALSRMRILAHRTHILLDAEKETGIAVIAAGGEQVLRDLALNVVETRIDFIHFPIVYYFHTDRRRSSLPHTLPELCRCAELASQPQNAEPVRFAAAALQTALKDLARILSRRFIHADDQDPLTIFRAYADAHVLKQDGSVND